MLDRNSVFSLPILPFASMLFLLAGFLAAPMPLPAQSAEKALADGGSGRGGSVELPRETYDRLVAAAGG